MAKTQFQPIGTVVTSAFCNSIYNTDGGHKHDGADDDGHAGKITDSELDDSAVTYIGEKVSSKVRNGGTIIGQIISYAGSNIPRGFLLCDGSEISRQEYPEYCAWADENAQYLTLNSKVVTPDLRGLFLVGTGVNAEYPLGSTGGEKEHILTEAEMPSHTHVFAADGAIGTGRADISAFNNYNNAKRTESAGGNQPHNNLPPYFAVRYLIRAYTEVEV